MEEKKFECSEFELNTSHQKVVKYFGVEIEVPLQTKCIVVLPTGHIIASACELYLNRSDVWDLYGPFMHIGMARDFTGYQFSKVLV